MTRLGLITVFPKRSSSILKGRSWTRLSLQSPAQVMPEQYRRRRRPASGTELYSKADLHLKALSHFPPSQSTPHTPPESSPGSFLPPVRYPNDPVFSTILHLSE